LGLGQARLDSWTSKEYRLLKGALFASLALSMTAATKKEKKKLTLGKLALVADT
jgi:hypothetical protein